MSEAKNHNHNQEKSPNNSFSLFLSGIVVGAILTYLFTTESGRKIKDELLKESSKLLDNLGDEIGKAKEKIEEKSEAFQRQIPKATQAVKEQIEDIKDEVVESAEKIPTQVEEIQKKGRRFFFKKHTSAEN
ncbi:MAG: hypothetical protein UU23_C0004G0062 [Candidatus Curtissbacteria bacterium GW2011_GWA1_40_9]|uniref:General stress protein n=1 Tax=Candidatus Curtissbacteria bacterium GW2011_GWA1_40_9 TaxID=1618408 RepID=A0A0G0W169_9BACT|nr:MAG: hypothetical protein UU23_C0004G0062 [Candidatus Curtissbacteria bacterium GW2011_GWA1_40_9]